jgi:hypothetical protein
MYYLFSYYIQSYICYFSDWHVENRSLLLSTIDAFLRKIGLVSISFRSYKNFDANLKIKKIVKL